jgi:hypothetical protein
MNIRTMESPKTRQPKSSHYWVTWDSKSSRLLVATMSSVFSCASLQEHSVVRSTRNEKQVGSQHFVLLMNKNNSNNHVLLLNASTRMKYLQRRIREKILTVVRRYNKEILVLTNANSLFTHITTCVSVVETFTGVQLKPWQCTTVRMQLANVHSLAKQLCCSHSRLMFNDPHFIA